jgi:general secretion pathway protein K
MKRTQAGAALLLAMLTVALVATFAASALWQQWRSIEVETAERARLQSSWILTGSLDWARLLLREDARPGSDPSDHLGEPWAVPLEEARLSSFLAADRTAGADLGSDVMEAFLSGQISDLQSRLNIRNLIESSGKVHDADVEAFARLFQILGLSQSELEKLVENLRFAVVASLTSPGAPQASLVPQRTDQLVWLGISPETVAALEPHVAILDARQRTQVNINTASAEVIAAAAGVDVAQAQRLVQERDRSHFKNLQEAQRILGGSAATPLGQSLGVSSRFFEVRARLRLDKLIVEERSVLERNGTDVRVVGRERAIADPNARQQVAAPRR